ncbi:MAG: U32 family peptidase [Acidiferrobacterales bacterium]
MKLSIGPIQYFWDRNSVMQFYAAIAQSPVDIVYLGETVCAKRRALNLGDWLDIGAHLAKAGKEVVLSTLVLVEAASELSYMRRIVENGRYRVEANDMAAVNMLAGYAPFMVGPHINVYNSETLRLFADLGAYRWAPPLELGREAVAALQAHRPAGIETEVLAYGRLPLAFSARCFTARANSLPKDSCQFRCGDYPDGMQLDTREGQPFLVLNGIQVQSGSTANLVREIDELRKLDVDVLRISPQSSNMGNVITWFRGAIDGKVDIEKAAVALGADTQAKACNGYWYGLPGMDWLAQSAL